MDILFNRMLSRKILPRAKQTFIWLITQPFHKFLTYAFATYRQYFHTKQQILYSEKKSFGGYITRLEKRYLLIDNYIYSTYEAFITSGNSTSTQRFPRYGDYIEGEMERSRSLLGSTGGWKVVSAHITTPPPDSKSPIPICRGDYNPSHITDHTSSASSIPKLDGELRASSELGGENGLAHSTCTSDPLIVPAPYYLEQFQIPAVIQSIMRQGERSVLANFPEILQVLIILHNNFYKLFSIYIFTMNYLLGLEREQLRLEVAHLVKSRRMLSKSPCR